jgi:hypothetical protein
MRAIIKKYWNDPVWSKVISAGIIAAGALQKKMTSNHRTLPCWPRSNKILLSLRMNEQGSRSWIMTKLQKLGVYMAPKFAPIDCCGTSDTRCNVIRFFTTPRVSYCKTINRRPPAPVQTARQPEAA